jgi:hypothetical protein
MARPKKAVVTASITYRKHSENRVEVFQNGNYKGELLRLPKGWAYFNGMSHDKTYPSFEIAVQSLLKDRCGVRKKRPRQCKAYLAP